MAGSEVRGLALAVGGSLGGRFLSRNSQRIDVELGGQIIEGQLGEEAILRMARRTHGPGGLDVDADDACAGA